MMTTNSDMIVDVVDIRNRIIGCAKRADVMRKGLNFRTVHVILVDQMGRIVVQILAAHYPRSPGLRGSSVAGYVRSGETYLAAKRKIVAELNLTTELKAVAEIKMFDQESIKFVGLFTGTIEQEPKILSRDIQSIEFLSLSEIKVTLAADPLAFTETFRVIFPAFLKQVEDEG
jgi:isopentenyldiphosphate isomerase